MRTVNLLSFLFRLSILFYVLIGNTSYSQNLNFSSSGTLIYESVIGQTLHSLQSNRGVPVHLVNHGNGTLSATWTFTPLSFLQIERGTGYNFYDGANWGPFPLQRIEYKRTGTTNIAAVNGWEYCMAHSGDSGLLLSKRPIGSGAWTYHHPVGTYNLFNSQADVWCRFAVGGSNGNTIHAIVNSQGTGTMPVLGQNGPLTYTRSLDGGVTWDLDHVQLPMSDSSYFTGFSAENYHIDCRNDIVAIVAGGMDMGVYLWKSIDNGSNWTRTAILPFPIPFYNPSTMITDVNQDGIADTIVTGNEDPTVSIDNNGLAHVAFGRMKLIDDDTASYWSYDPLTDGLFYWNENMPAPAVIANAEDFNGNGKIDIPTVVAPNTVPVGRYLGGLIVHPSIGFDDNNDIYISYSSVNELADTSDYQCMRRHVYLKRSSDGGTTWGPAINIVPSIAQGDSGEFREAVYGSLAKKVDGSGANSCAHILYQRDRAPYIHEFSAGGLGLNIQSAWNADQFNISFSNDMIYAKVCNISSKVEEGDINNDAVSIYPNPASQIIYIKQLNSSIPFKQLEIINAEGKPMMKSDLKYNLDVSTFPEGVYTLLITGEKSTSTARFVVSRK